MKIVIRVEGGDIQEIHCDQENVEVEIFDFDQDYVPDEYMDDSIEDDAEATTLGEEKWEQAYEDAIANLYQIG